MQHGSPPGLWEGGSALVAQGGQVGKPTAEEHQIYEKIYIIFTPLCSPEKRSPSFSISECGLHRYGYYKDKVNYQEGKENVKLQHKKKSIRKFDLRRNGTPPLFDVPPFEINNENYFLLISIICTTFGNYDIQQFFAYVKYWAT